MYAIPCHLVVPLDGLCTVHRCICIGSQASSEYWQKHDHVTDEDFERHQPLDVIRCGITLPAYDAPEAVEGFQQDSVRSSVRSSVRLTIQDPMAADSFAQHPQIPARATKNT